MTIDTVISSFELQAGWCDDMGSPFTASLMRAAAADMRADGFVAKLIGDWPGNPLADALMMRFAGALHAAALSKRDADLAALYPDNNPNWRFDDIWPAALAFMQRDETWFREFLKSPPQTNETRRSIALLPAFLSLARHGPLHLLEIGASAGLNQMWDRFRYETPAWSWGEMGGPFIDTDWRGDAPTDLDVRPVIASRAACDRNPLDVRNPDHGLRLSAYVWADQPERFTRLQSAIALARDANVHVESADAAEWVEAKLAGELPVGVTVLYHSVVWQYLASETRVSIEAAVEAAAKRATPERRMAWVRYEVGRLFGLDGPIDQMGIEVRSWPGNERRVIARADGHARWVEYLA